MVPGPGQEPARQARRAQRPAELGQRVGRRRPGGRLARSVTSTSSPSAAARQARQEPAGVGTDAAGHARRSCSTARSTERVRSATAAPPRRGRALSSPSPQRSQEKRADHAVPAAQPAPHRLVGQAALERRGQAVVIARAPPERRRRRAPRAASRPGSPPPARRRAWPAAAGSRTPRRATGRRGRRPGAAARRGRAPSTQPVRTIRARGRRRGDGCGERLLTPARRAGQDEGQVAAGASATASKARTRPGRSLRGSAVPTARQ